MKISRRELLTRVPAGIAAASLFGSSFGQRAEASPKPASVTGSKPGRPHNVLFVFTDQERHFGRWPTGLDLPGHERMARSGTYFENHYIGATMCTSSRSILMTGLQTVDNGMFENLDVPWTQDLSTEIPTIGHMLRRAGYYTAYKGKWHLTRSFDQESPPRHLFTTEMDAYGFADYVSPGDVVGHTLGGYDFDQLISGSAVAWLRRVGGPLNDEGKPWFLTVSLVNPHDIMYFNTDAPGQHVQDNGHLLSHAARAPKHALYRAEWDVPVPASLTEPFDRAGRPGAHNEYQKAWDCILGHIPPEQDRWRRFNNFYINSIRSVDSQIAGLLNELDALGLSDNTIIVFTSDHGEMAGAHGLRGKGPFAYEECIHVPFCVVHPDVAGGGTCTALTAHIDVAPTFLAMAGVGEDQRGEVAGRDLPGRDLTPVVGSPGSAATHAVRDGILYTYSGLASNDGDVMLFVSKALAEGKDPKAEMKKTGFRPDLKKRGTMRTVFDGRYKFSRYFSPLEHHRPNDPEMLHRYNDLELFDLESDPQEMNNLAGDPDSQAELVAQMSEKLESLIRSEIGVDDGRELPALDGIRWSMEQTRFD